MPRWRLGVALLVPEPFRSEINGLRRALGDGALLRIPPHLTLVPPVNVRVDEVPAALAVLRSAASKVEPFRARLGPVATFAPLTPVIKLDVSGDEGRIEILRNAVFRPPLERVLTWPFVPHVTLADEADAERIERALPALDGYGVDAPFESMTLLREESGRAWAPIADVALGPSLQLGRGSLPLEVTQGSILDPEAGGSLGLPAPRVFDLVLIARREGQVVAGTTARVSDQLCVVHSFVVKETVRGQGVGVHLAKSLVAAAAQKNEATQCVSRIPCPQITAFLERFGIERDPLA